MDASRNWRKGACHLFSVCGKLHVRVIPVKMESVERKDISKRVKDASD